MIKDIFIGGNGGWLGAVTRLGTPVVVTFILVWFLIAKVDTTQALIIANQSSIMVNQAAIMASMNEAKVVMGAYAIDQQRDGRIMTALLLQTCLNTSTDKLERGACIAATVGPAQ